MEHTNCLAAINKFKETQPMQMYIQKKICTCPRMPSPCDWVGNSIHYACLQKEYEYPERCMVN